MSAFMTPSWPQACLSMSLDVAAVVDALFVAGVESITVKDFHRTGYNLFTEHINKKAKVVQGYKTGPVPGIGNPSPATAVLMIGMHAPSGSSGFLAHTLTSRIARLEVNGELLSEAQLFSSSLAPAGLVPLFFSGCPVACHHTLQKIDGIQCFPIKKIGAMKDFNEVSWRNELAREAVSALNNKAARPYSPEGPFSAVVEMRDGAEIAQKLATRWKLDSKGSEIYLKSQEINELYQQLMRICYLTPMLEPILPLGLPLYNLKGRFGLLWAKNKVQNAFRKF